MASGPLVSFVVPCYNYARYLPDCLRGIFDQEGGYDFEVIAVDDASTDNTLEVLEQFRDPRIQVLKHERNQGHVKTVNEGLAAARGEFVARIDPDDRYRPEFLRTLLPKFSQYPEVGLVYGDAAVINSAGTVNIATSDKEHNGVDFKGNELTALLCRNFICAPTAIARRNAWHEAMPVPAHLAFNDWYFNVMMARRHDFCYVNHVVADYRVHPQNHHARIVADKSEEPSIRHILDYFFSETESTPALEARKQSCRGRAYSSQYVTLARKYFGAGLLLDARRCFLEALRFSPADTASVENFRLLLATYLSPGTYSTLKRLVKSQPASR